MASDNLYKYVMERLPETKQVTGAEAKQMFIDQYYSEALRKSAENEVGFDIDRDGYHDTMKRISEALRFRYERVTKK